MTDDQFEKNPRRTKRRAIVKDSESKAPKYGAFRLLKVKPLDELPALTPRSGKLQVTLPALRAGARTKSRASETEKAVARESRRFQTPDARDIPTIRTQRRVDAPVARRKFLTLTEEIILEYLKIAVPGDIILHKATRGDRNFVCVFQARLGFSSQAAKVSHVSMYVGDCQYCHSMPSIGGGVSNLLGKHRGRNHRAKDGVMIGHLTELIGEEIAIIRSVDLHEQNCIDAAAFVRDQVGSGYDYEQVRLCFRAHVMKILRTSGNASDLNEAWNDHENSSKGKNFFICSDLIFSAFESSLEIEASFIDGKWIKPQNPLITEMGWRGSVCLPADIFINPYFMDVFIERSRNFI